VCLIYPTSKVLLLLLKIGSILENRIKLYHNSFRNVKFYVPVLKMQFVHQNNSGK
jgi:hypothetical protein